MSHVRSLSSANLADIELVAMSLRLFAVAHTIAGLAIAYTAIATASIWLFKGNIWYLGAHLTFDLLFIAAFIAILFLIIRYFPHAARRRRATVYPIMAA